MVGRREWDGFLVRLGFRKVFGVGGRRGGRRVWWLGLCIIRVVLRVVYVCFLGLREFGIWVI